MGSSRVLTYSSYVPRDAPAHATKLLALRLVNGMIWNVIDRRAREHRWKAITAIVEPVSHDNSCMDSDQADEAAEEAFAYDHRPEISLADAVVWAQSLPFAVTLYLYDLGEGIR